MAHALAPHPAAAPARKHQRSSLPAVAVLGRFGPHLAQQQHGPGVTTLHQRRTFIYALIGAGLGSALHGGEAIAAARRPPPPPPAEKNDPNVSGVQAKVIASKKRKEAMKEAMKELRERGKPINVPTNKPPQ